MVENVCYVVCVGVIMPRLFDIVGVHSFEGSIFVGSTNKYPTKVSFLEACLKEYGQEESEYDSMIPHIPLEDLLNDIKTVFVRGCVCSLFIDERDSRFHYEIASDPKDSICRSRYGKRQRGIFECWQYGEYI